MDSDPDIFDPQGPQAKAALALRVQRPLGPHTYMYRPSRFVPNRKQVQGGSEAMHEAWAEASVRFAEVVSASWDGFVLTIRNGRYSDLYRVREALQRYRGPYWKDVLTLELARLRATTAHVELDRVLKRYASQLRSAEVNVEATQALTLFDALVPDATDPDHQSFQEFSRHGWLSSYTSPDIFPNKADKTFDKWQKRFNYPNYFYLSPPYASDIGTEREREMESNGIDPRHLWLSFDSFDFKPDSTFEEAHNRVTTEWDSINSSLRECRDLVEVINLRLSILGAVLYEHEVYGHVPLWTEMTPEGRASVTRRDGAASAYAYDYDVLRERYIAVRPDFDSDASAREAVCDWYAEEMGGGRPSESTVRRALRERE